jgi:flagellar biosynthetic protein FliQ
MISQGQVMMILTNAVTTVIIAAAPMLIIAMVIGLVVSVFQATTQSNEQTLAFVPKIVGVMLALVIFGSFIFSTVAGFATTLFESINEFPTS